MLRYLPLILLVAFIVYCVFDVLGSDVRARRGLPVPVWLLVVVAVPVAGGVAWLVLSRRAPSAGSTGPGRGGPIAPDDDPEFLFRLDQERRRRERQDGTSPRDESTDGGAGGQGTTDGSPTT